MKDYRNLILSVALLSLSPAHAQAEPIAAPGDPSEIVAGATLFGTTPMGCYASRDAISISKLRPFVGDKMGDWVNGIELEAKEPVNGIDIVMSCAVSPDGLTIKFSAPGYEPNTYAAKWESTKPTTLASADSF